MNWLKNLFKKRKTVLIVEDETENALLLTTFLTLRGFETRRSKDGVDGLQAAKKWTPDLILLDIMMPDLDGIEVLKDLKSYPGTKNIPVLMCTVLSKIEEVEKCCRAGAQGYILKPMDLERMLDKINSVLSGRGSQEKEFFKLVN